MNRTVILIVAVFTVLNISSFFIIPAHAPKYTVFTGAVHYPPDYLYYLSFITQGREHWLLGANLKSGETMKLDALNWVYVFGGHIGSLFRLPPPVIYQVLVVIGSMSYLLVAYYLMYLLFPKRPTSRLIGYLLFLLSNAFPKIYFESGRLVYSFFYPFNNLGHPFERLTNVPHHLFISAGIMAAFAVAARYWQTKQNYWLFVSAALGAWIAGMQPLQWAFVTGVIGLGGVFSWWRSKSVQDLLPPAALFVAGLPFAVYIKLLFAGPIYTYMMQWERDQQVIIPFLDFIKLNGPVMLLGLIGFPFVVRRCTPTEFPLLLYSVLSIGIFFSPLPQKLGFMNLRFLSVIPTLTASYISAHILWTLATKVAPAQKKTASWFAAFLLIAITIPVTLAQTFLGRPHTSPDDMNIYLPLGAYQTYGVASKIIKQDETTLVTPLLVLSFPALTGRHVFSADPFGTVQFARKSQEAVDFFNAKEPEDVRIDWLRRNKIAYILTYAWTPIPLENLTVAYKNDYAILYKVH